MSKSILSLFIITVGLVQLGFTQTRSAWIKAADKAFEKEDYYSAYRYYGIALEYDDSDIDVWYKYGQSARNFNADSTAEAAYRVVLNSPLSQSYPEANYWMGVVKQRRGHYEEAIVFLERFLDQDPSPGEQLATKARNSISDSQWALGVVSQAEDLNIRHLTDGINSPYSDFAPALVGDTLYYSSFKFLFKKDTLNPPRNFIKIMRSIGSHPGKPLKDDFQFTDRHVAHSAFNSSYSKMYFTVCEYDSITDIRCDLYVSKRHPDGTWARGEAIALNDSLFTSTQPSVGTDRNTSEEYLYFSSDRPGGKGQLDIWRCKINADGSFADPENLSAINTEGNDVTPFFHTLTQTLFFSTDGRQSLGGYDVYRSRLRAGGWSRPEHMGAPLNSSYDDLYYSVFSEGTRVYFSSNRPDSAAIFWDDTRDACCNDIYQFDIDNTVELEVLTFDVSDESPLEGVTVRLYEVTPEGERLIAEITNPTSNDFNFPLEAGKKYKIQGERPGYLPTEDIIDLNDPELAGQKKIQRRLLLGRTLRLEARLLRKIDGSPLEGGQVTLYEIQNGVAVPVDSISQPSGYNYEFPLEPGKKYVIKGAREGFFPETDTIDLITPLPPNQTTIKRDLSLGQALLARTFDAGDNTPLDGVTVELFELGEDGPKLVDRITNDGGNEFLFPIDMDKKYLITASKEGYEGINDTLRFSPEDVVRAGGKLQVDLFLKRISFDDFLPLALYFDNDHPNPNTLRYTSDKAYVETNVVYYDKKEEFIRIYTEAQPAEDKFLTSRRFNDFFEREVLGGRKDLEAFTTKLLHFLEEGNELTIMLKGYASPRASETYNKILSARRIDCVKNHFREYQDGAFLRFLDSGQLSIREENLGESTANLDLISDRIDDPANSIFSVIASVERRVEIVEVKTSLDPTTSISE